MVEIDPVSGNGIVCTNDRIGKWRGKGRFIVAVVSHWVDLDFDSITDVVRPLPVLG
jgi:hypothetical protein